MAGPLIDLIQMLLIALFRVQEEEASQYRTEAENLSSIKQEEISDNINLQEATRFATIAAGWSKKYQGLPLADLPLYSLTTSEVLRLHLLSSGAIINMTGARWRYQQRGGYLSEDDPGLYLRLHSPHILKALKTHNIVELPIVDKLQVLSCLINQLLTYADVRDIVEERMEKIRQAKTDYKMTLMTEKKREQEFLTARHKLKKKIKTEPKAVNDLQKLEAEAERKKAENHRKLEEFKKASYDKQIVMGQDRAFRQYIRLESVPGFFINSEEENPGTCFSNIIEQVPHLVNASRDETIAYLKKTLQESNSSDKENSPAKSPKKVNGVHNGVKIEISDELMMCSADPETCIVHSSNRKQNRWCFYHESDQLDQLIDGLNKRGIRESKLEQNLTFNRDEIEKIMNETPVNTLNTEIPVKEERKRRKTPKTKYENANLGYPKDMSPTEILHDALIEHILEMEEKIYAGNLGCLHIKDRENWRNCLQNKNYKELDKTLIETEQNDTEKSTEEREYSDPSQHLGTGKELIPDIDNNEVSVSQNNEIKEAIQSLSIALAQVAQSVEPKFLKKPLGRVNTSRNNKKKENVISKWEQSLLASTSFSQIFLHYSTLDSCVLWTKSLLLSKCRICRRRNDSENMLLCDGCNLGQHLYCLKPKLKVRIVIFVMLNY